MTRDDIRWFKATFGADIVPALTDTPFTLDFLAAIACQETGFIWGPLQRRGLSTAQILATCVGDVIDGPRRTAFPTSRAELLARPNGDRMWAIARQALVDMAVHRPEYAKYAANPARFCHGFGIFQCDLQHFRTDPDHFLQQRYLSMAGCVRKALVELRRCLRTNGLDGRPRLTDLELVSVAIAYNAGRYVPSRGLQQGHFDGIRYYGEYILDYLRMAQTVPLPEPGPLTEPRPGQAALTPPTQIDPIGTVYQVDTRETALRLRAAPSTTAAVIVRLPDGQRVRGLAARATAGFLQVETSVNGAHFEGYAARQFLVKVTDPAVVVRVPQPARVDPATGIVAVYAPRPAGLITRRRSVASAHALNEAGQPDGRHGTTPDELRAELDAVIDWLDVEKAAHLRYQPRGGITFCNIYAHDYCHLAGVYLPRVWWTPAAIERLARGEDVPVHVGGTVDEMRANMLYRWLRDFGLRFGWRQTSSLTTLQTEVNQGAVGLVIARRSDDARPGHVAMVVPERDGFRARRDAQGEVEAPLQSQAGASNFRRDTGRAGWWEGATFAESAFWLHA